MSGAVLAIFGAGSNLTVSASPPAASGGAKFGGHVSEVTAIASGGGGGYTYAWTTLETDHALTINSPADATTSFDFTGVASGDGATAIVRVTATSGGASAFRDVTVQFQNTN